jgi:hypothetical protein
MKNKFCAGQFGVSILLASIFATLTPMQAGADSGVTVKVQTLTVYVPAPPAGQPWQLPASIPEKLRGKVLELIGITPPGVPIVIAPEGTSPTLIQQAKTAAIKQSIVTQGAGPAGPTPQSCLACVLVIILVVVCGVAIYVVWKCAKKIDKVNTNTGPGDPAILRQLPPAQPSAFPPTLSGDDSNSTNAFCTIEGTTDLSAPNWAPMFTLVCVTNADGIPSVYAMNPSNILVGASSVITNSANPAELDTTTPLNLPYPGPGPTPPNLFFRMNLHN